MRKPRDYSHYDDEKLINLIAQYEEGALAELYDRYSRLVFSLALVIVDDRLTAEEITLDVFMRLWQKAATYRADRAKVSTWLTHIARHHAIDVLRRRSIRLDENAIRWDGLIPATASTDQDSEELAEQSLNRERIHSVITQLPVEQKVALRLAYFGGLTQKEIAEVLNEPLGTIKTRIHLAMHKLRKLLRDEQEVGNKSAKTVNAYSTSKEE